MMKKVKITLLKIALLFVCAAVNFINNASDGQGFVVKNDSTYTIEVCCRAQNREHRYCIVVRPKELRYIGEKDKLESANFKTYGKFYGAFATEYPLETTLDLGEKYTNMIAEISVAPLSESWSQEWKIQYIPKSGNFSYYIPDSLNPFDVFPAAKQASEKQANIQDVARYVLGLPLKEELPEPWEVAYAVEDTLKIWDPNNYQGADNTFARGVENIIMQAKDALMWKEKEEEEEEAEKIKFELLMPRILIEKDEEKEKEKVTQ